MKLDIAQCLDRVLESAVILSRTDLMKKYSFGIDSCRIFIPAGAT
jgi:hypothetical protein